MEQNEVQVKALIFDLDGTLLNTLQDLADAGNMALTACRLPVHDREAYRYFVGDGMETLMLRAAPEGTPSDVVDRLVTCMREEYAKNWDNKTAPYPGIIPMLQKLHALGFPLYVLSNKPHEFTLLTVERFFPGIPFTHIQGSPAGGKAKPDPKLALKLAADLGLAPANVLIVGDSSVDMDTAKAAGMPAAGVLWGFRTEEELRKHGARFILAEPDAIFSIL